MATPLPNSDTSIKHFKNASSHQSAKLPVIQLQTLDLSKERKKHSSLSFVHSAKIPFGRKHSNPKQVGRQIRSQSLQAHRNKERENAMRMEKSIHRFMEKENYITKTLLQKKKQKKFYSIESFQNQEMDFFSSLARDTLLKQEIVQEEPAKSREFPLKALPSVCYDSQFIFQREGSCLTLLNNKLYLFGGAIRRRFFYPPLNESQVNIDVLFHSYDDDRWVREQVINQISNDKKNLIHHTVNAVLKKYIVIAGGMMGDSQKTLSKFNESIMVYNSETKKIQEIPWNVCLRSHASVAFDNYVICQGGINQDGNIRSDIHILALSPTKQTVTVKAWKFESGIARAHHQLISTLGEDKNFKINLRENNGIYMFGGEDENGRMGNEMKILKIYSANELERKSIKSFQTIKGTGESPSPRKNHSMNLIPKKNSIVIIGGVDQKTNILSDAWLFQLCQYRWSRIETEPSIDIFFGGIHKHATVSNHSSLFILGGRSLKDNGNSNLWEMDFSIQSYERRVKERKFSQLSKISSCWSIGKSKGRFGTSDKIIFND